MAIASHVTTDPQSATTPAAALGRAHWQRLRRMYRSAGWPCHDVIELDLLNAGMLERVMPPSGIEFLRVTDAGVESLSTLRQSNRRSASAHDALLERVAADMAAQGRICFAELNLRAKPAERWMAVRPDLFSIRNTSREAYLAPVVHEIKVSRADLLSDLKKPDKHGAYLSIAAQCFYVIAEGIGDASEIPECCGVMLARSERLEILRPAPAQERKLDFATWMALTKAMPYRADRLPQPCL